MDAIWTKCLFEFIGTAILVLFGDGVVASTVLKKSKGENGGWVVITLAWGLAVMLGVFIAGPYSGAHLNPAVTLGLAAAGTFSWAYVLPCCTDAGRIFWSRSRVCFLQRSLRCDG